MPHDITLITTIAASLGLALVFGLLAERLRLPALVGYLLAGVLIGPATPGFVADQSLSRELAEIGVMLLMFGVGLHFSLADLLAVRRMALPGALVQMGVATALSAGVAHAWGWGLGAGLVFGLALSVASTVVLLRALGAARAAPVGQRTDRRGLAGGGGPGDGPGPGLPSPAGRLSGRAAGPPPAPARGSRPGWAGGSPAPCRPPLAEISAFVALMLLVGPAPLPLAAVAGGGHRVAGAVRPERGRGRGGDRIRGGSGVRGVLRPRRLLRRHGPARVALEPPGGAGVAAVARRLLGAVLRLRGDALRPPRADRAAAGRPGGGRHRGRRQVARRLSDRDRLPLSAQHRA